VAEAIMEHRFAPVKRLWWRNSELEFGSVDAADRSLEEADRRRMADARAGGRRPDGAQGAGGAGGGRARIADARDVRLLWDVCRIPDFRGISHAEHADLLGRIFGFLHDGGRVPDDWLRGRSARIDRTDGDIDTLSKRLAYIRTWTYVAQRTGWVEDESHWRGRPVP
jgi:ATP-dependent RNA helicase SUPV3L1/SUV3